MVRGCKTLKECPMFGKSQCAISRLKELVGVLSVMYRIRKKPLLDGMPGFVDCDCVTVNSLKKFCGGLIEGESHPWRAVVRSCSRRQRFAIAATLFLFRKVLPTLSPDLDLYMRKMSSPQDHADGDFVEFARRRIRTMFPPGWDKSYIRECERSILPSSSCVERGRGEGGVRDFVASGDSWLNQPTYEDVTKNAKPGSLELKPSRVVAVETGGKQRIVSVPCVEMNLLRPLHHCFYDRLSKFPWLLRGDAKPSAFKEFTKVDGEVFVSGDYESATDNLNQEVQEFILREVLQQTRFVPPGIAELAMKSLRMQLSSKGKVVDQQRGQLMGNLLSFPLLCLVNFLGFKYSVRRRVPLKINGDDIVFRASKAEAEKWFEGVGLAGLTLSKGKTLMDRAFFSLNSTFFEGRSSRVARIPVIRSKSLFGCVEEGVASLADRWNSYAKGVPRTTREGIDSEFLRINRRFVLASGRSLRNGLMIDASEKAMRDSGLMRREQCYIDVRGGWIEEKRLQDVFKTFSPYRVDGWKLQRAEDTKEVREQQKEYQVLLRREIWTQPPGDSLSLENKKLLIKQTGWNVNNCGVTKEKVLKFAHLSGLSRREASRLLNRERRLPPVSNDARGEMWWIPDMGRSRRIVFLSSGFTRC